MSVSPLILPFQDRTFESASTLRASITAFAFSTSADLNATGELKGSTSLAFSEVGALTLGRITGSTSLDFSASATYSSPLIASPAIAFSATAIPSALVEIQGSTSIAFSESASFIGAPLFTISPLLLPTVRYETSVAIQATKGSTSFGFTTDATLTGSGGLGGNRIFGSTNIDIFDAFVWLVGKGELKGSASVGVVANAALAGSVLGSTSLDFTATGTIAALPISGITGATAVDFTNTGALQGKGQLQASTSIAVSTTGAARAVGVLKGATVIRFLNPGALIRFVEGGTSFGFTATGVLLQSVDTSEKVRPSSAQVRSLRPDDTRVKGRRPANIAVGGRR